MNDLFLNRTQRSSQEGRVRHILAQAMLYSFSRVGFVSGRTPDAGRKVRLFDMERLVVHTRYNYFFKCENRVFFFHLLTKERLDPYFTHLVM